MKLSKLIQKIKHETSMDDPEVYFLPVVIGDIHNMFDLEVTVDHRNQYFDESGYGNELPKGDYVILEIG